MCLLVVVTPCTILPELAYAVKKIKNGSFMHLISTCHLLVETMAFGDGSLMKMLSMAFVPMATKHRASECDESGGN